MRRGRLARLIYMMELTSIPARTTIQFVIIGFLAIYIMGYKLEGRAMAMLLREIILDCLLEVVLVMSIVELILKGGSSGNIIGGTGAGQGNYINGCLYWGIEVKEAGSINNIISGNSISCNDYGGIEISTGGNAGMATPVITAANGTTVSGTSAANAVIQVFRASDVTALGCPTMPSNQGADYLGTTTANAGGLGLWREHLLILLSLRLGMLLEALLCFLRE